MGRRKRGKLGKVILGVGAVAAAAGLVTVRLPEQTGDKPLEAQNRYVVARVLDGDTFELEGGDRVRLLSIDTPEAGEPLHDEAKQLLSKLTLGKPVRLEFATNRRDKYGRLLGYLYVDSIFVNKIILENGLGYLYLFKDNDVHSAEVRTLLTAQRSALSRHIGLYALEHEKESYYVSPNRGFRFHRPGCRGIESSQETSLRKYPSREEALQDGLSPCRTCKP